MVIPKGVLKSVATTLRIPDEKQDRFCEILMGAVAHSHQARYPHRQRSGPLVETLTELLAKLRAFELALTTVRENAHTDAALQAFISANGGQAEFISDIEGKLRLLRKCSEASIKFVKTGYPGRGSADSRAQQPNFKTLVVTLNELTKAFGGRATINKGKQGGSRKWTGTLLSAIENMRPYLPTDFCPAGDLGRAIGAVVKSA